MTCFPPARKFWSRFREERTRSVWCRFYAKSKISWASVCTLPISTISCGARSQQADSEYVAGLAADLGLPCTIERRDVRAYQKRKRLSLEEAAREVRYQFLARGSPEDRGSQGGSRSHSKRSGRDRLAAHSARGGDEGFERIAAPAGIESERSRFEPGTAIVRG